MVSGTATCGSRFKEIILLFFFVFADQFQSHLPDIASMEGLTQLLSLAALNFLGNVLDFRTYSAPNQEEDEDISDAQRRLMLKYDCCDISRNERASMCYARGVSLAIFGWVRRCIVVVPPDGQEVHDYPSYMLARILKTLLKYKAVAMQQQLVGAPHCNTAALRKQIENVVASDTSLSSYWKDGNCVVFDSDFLFAPPDGLRVRYESESEPIACKFLRLFFLVCG